MPFTKGLMQLNAATTALTTTTSKLDASTVLPFLKIDEGGKIVLDVRDSVSEAIKVCRSVCASLIWVFVALS
jgi:hypothetical protein